MFGKKKMKAELEEKEKYRTFQAKLFAHLEKQLEELEKTHEIEIRGLIKGLGIRCPKCDGSGWEYMEPLACTAAVSIFSPGKGNCSTCGGRGWLLRREKDG